MKKIIALLLAVMMVLAMAACAAKTTDTPAPAETDAKTDAVQETATEAAADGKTELNIGVLVWKYSDTYGSSVRVAMDKYAKEIGAEKGLTINLEMQDGNDDQATQNNQADVMFAAGKDHIIINLCDTSAGQYLVDLAKQYNVPISFYNKEPVDSTIVTGSNSIFVGTKPEEAGIMQGEILADLYAANPERVDKNGDGKVVVQVATYNVDFDAENENTDAYYQMAGVTRLSAELSSGGKTYIFLLEDPEGFEKNTGVLQYLDGTVDDDPETADPDWREMVYRWTDCPVLTGLDLGSYEGLTLMDDVTGTNQSVLEHLYVGRRGVWDEEQAENYAHCAALWDALTAGAVSTAAE